MMNPVCKREIVNLVKITVKKLLCFKAGFDVLRHKAVYGLDLPLVTKS